MSWLLNELNPIDVNSGAEVYKFNSNETPTDTNKTFVRICQEKHQGMCVRACVYARQGEGIGCICECECVTVHGKAVGGKARDDIE